MLTQLSLPAYAVQDRSRPGVVVRTVAIIINRNSNSLAVRPIHTVLGFKELFVVLDDCGQG